MDPPTSLFDSSLDGEVKDGALDPVYLHVRDDEDCVDDRAYLDQIWNCFGIECRDRHFATEFRLLGKFQARAWELRLGWALRDLGFAFRWGGHGPDFSVSAEKPFHIEAVAPAATEALTSNYEVARNWATTVPVNEIVLRYTGSIFSKLDTYSRYVARGMIRATDPYVIALSGANIPQASLSGSPFPWVLLPLFAIGQKERRTSTGGRVSCDIFLESGQRQLSALIFAPHHIKNRPEHSGRPPGDDFLVVHNPHATNPLPRGTISRGREWAATETMPEMVADWRSSKAP